MHDEVCRSAVLARAWRADHPTATAWLTPLVRHAPPMASRAVLLEALQTKPYLAVDVLEAVGSLVAERLARGELQALLEHEDGALRTRVMLLLGAAPFPDTPPALADPLAAPVDG